MKIQVMCLSAVNNVKTAGEHGIGGLSDLVTSASAEKINDLDKVVRMAMGRNITDVFFDQNALFVDKVGVFFIDSHENLSFMSKIQIDYIIRSIDLSIKTKYFRRFYYAIAQ